MSNADQGPGNTPGSSNGRIPGSEPGDSGSSPLPGTRKRCPDRWPDKAELAFRDAMASMSAYANGIATNAGPTPGSSSTDRARSM